MNYQKGFIGLSLILAIVLGLAVLGGGAYLVTHKSVVQEVVPLPYATTTGQTVNTPVQNTQNDAVTFFASPSSGTSPLRVTFSGFVDTKIYGEGGYGIDFGDGNIRADYGVVNCPSTSNKCGISVDYVYKKPGTYKAKFATNNCVHITCNLGPAITTAAVTVSEPSQVSVSVPGMSQYTDSDFGFSFWYPSGWRVTKHHSGSDPSSYFEILIVDEQTASNISILEMDDKSGGLEATGCGTCMEKAYFDAVRKTWMLDTNDFTGGSNPTRVHVVSTVDVSSQTMGGLPIFWGDTVGVNAHTFLQIGSVSKDVSKLIKTIVASNPSVATPVSLAKQKVIIEAEQKAYAEQ